MLLKLLALPVSLPAAGIRYCIEKVAEVADAELNSEEPIKEELLRLQLELEEGSVDEASYVAREGVLLARLRQVREIQRERLREQLEERTEDATTRGRSVYIEIPDELR